MSQAELIQQAKKGDAGAIAQLLHISLYTRGIRVKTHRAVDCLQILLEAHQFPDRQHLVAFIHRGIVQLQVETFKTVEIYARHPDTTQFIWCDGFTLQKGGKKMNGSLEAPRNRTQHDTDPQHVTSNHQSNISSHEESTYFLEDSPPIADSEAVDENHSDPSLAEMSPSALAQQARVRMATRPDPPQEKPQHKGDLGWMLVDKLQRLNPFAAGLMTILTLHSILGSRHYTPEGFINASDPMMMYLHNINLIIHEVGHPIFGIFGQFIGLLGGSLLQVLVPGFIAGYFFFTKQRFAGAIALWWTGQSILDVSFYVKDAQERAIPLLGGEAVLHDWHFLLLRMHLLPYDDVIAGMVFSIGILLYLVAIPLGFYCAYAPPGSSGGRRFSRNKITSDSERH